MNFNGMLNLLLDFNGFHLDLFEKINFFEIGKKKQEILNLFLNGNVSCFTDVSIFKQVIEERASRALLHKQFRLKRKTMIRKTRSPFVVLIQNSFDLYVPSCCLLTYYLRRHDRPS